MTDYVCEQCRESIDEAVTTCPYCGHEGAQISGIVGVVLLLLGGLLTMTVIGAIVGLPMMYFGYRAVKRGGQASPAVEERQ